MRRYLASAVVAVSGLSILSFGSVGASAAPAGGWVLFDEMPYRDTVPVAVDPVAGTMMFAQFDPNHPPATLNTMNSADRTGVAAIDAGLAPGFTNDSVDETTGRMYVSGYGSSNVLSIDTSTGQVVHTFTNTQWMPFASAVDDTRNLIYVVDGNDNNWHPSGSVTVLDGATDTQVTQVFVTGGSFAYPAVSPEHQKLYIPVEAGGGGVLVFDTATNQEADHISGSGELTLLHPFMAIADDDLDLVFLLQSDPIGEPIGSIAKIDSSTDEVVGPTIEFGRYFTGDDSMTYDSQRKQLIVGGMNVDTGVRAIITIDAITGEVISTVETPANTESIFGMAVDPGPHRLVVATLSMLLVYVWQEPELAAPRPELAATGPSVEWHTAAIPVLLVGGGILLATATRRRRADRLRS